MRRKAADAEIGQQKCWKEKIMNKVFVSGIIAGEPALHSSENGMAHLIFPLSVRHRTMNGMMPVSYTHLVTVLLVLVRVSVMSPSFA